MNVASSSRVRRRFRSEQNPIDGIERYFASERAAHCSECESVWATRLDRSDRSDLVNAAVLSGGLLAYANAAVVLVIAFVQ